MKQLYTQWGGKIDKEQPLKEYPRMQMRRDSYLCLNGTWKLLGWGGSMEITVPFSPESALSGVGRILAPGEPMTYVLDFDLPEGFMKDRLLLHFGSVDQECTVCVNGKELGKHRGGYEPFSFDITDVVRPKGNSLTVTVTDDTEEEPYARGKQRYRKLKGRLSYLYYTPQSGIWKTVWLESVPEDHIERLTITPSYNKQQAVFDLTFTGAGDRALEILVHEGDESAPLWQYRGKAEGRITAPLSGLKPWTPEDPKLYEVTIRYGEDRVESYFGLRDVTVERDSKGILRFCLNGEPIFMNGVLDQGYWPESLMTPPSDEALLADILQVKALGYNTIRKHIKVECDRFYYHCDRLGVLVWQDMPCGGGPEYNKWLVSYLPNILPASARWIGDRHYGLLSRESAEGRELYYEELRAMIRGLYSHPSIVCWTPFNEGWGQFDAKKATELIRREDPTRIVNEACGWFDQRGGDVYSIHNYFHKLHLRPQRDRAVALTEYGGYALPVEGHTACDKQVGYKSFDGGAELMDKYEQLWRTELLPAIKKGLSAAIYTQVSDIEEEINGLLTYDRAVVKFPAERMRSLHEEAERLFEEAAGPKVYSTTTAITAQATDPAGR